MAREILGWIPGSARKMWGLIASTLRNERGEAGSDEAGSEEETKMEKGWEDSKEIPPPEPSQEEAKPKEEGGKEEAAEEEAAEEEEVKEEPAEEAEEQEPDEIATLKGELERERKRGDFYEQQYNDLIGEGEEEEETDQPPSKKPAATPAPPGEMPQGVKKPGEWEDQNEEAAYVDWRSGQVASERANEAIRQQVAPVFKRIDKVVAALQEAIVSMKYNDYDEVVKAAMDDAFLIDPATGEVQGEKNPALLKLFRAQVFPQDYMYQYAMSKQGKKKVTEGIKKGTKKALERIVKRPTGPKRPTGTAPSTTQPELDWDTPPSERDRVLQKRGIIK